MEFEEIVQLINQDVLARKGRPLKSVERIVLEGAWHNRTYTAMAKEGVGYTEDYLKKDVGPTLWKLLSEVLSNNSIKITKRNIQNVLQDWAAQRRGGEEPAQPEPLVNPGVPQQPLVIPTLPVRETPPVDVSEFWGREEDLAQLQRWLGDDGCRLVMLWGLSGCGKTLLAAKLMEQSQAAFSRCCYLALPAGVEMSALGLTLARWLGSETLNLPPDPWEWIAQQLTQQRVLLILDGGDALFAADQEAGTFGAAYGPVRDCLQRVAQAHHKSCVLWISRERPLEMRHLEGQRVRSHLLRDFPAAAVPRFLALRGEVSATEADWQQLVERYGGNPQLLKSLSGTILEFYRGSLSQFLAAHQPLPTPLQEPLQAALGRLQAPELTLLHWLVIAQEPLAYTTLEQELLTPLEMATVQSLVGRGLCLAADQLTLTVPPLVRQHVGALAADQLKQELDGGELDLFHRVPLQRMSATERVQERQVQALLQPLAEYLRQQYPSEPQLMEAFQRLHRQVRSQFLNQPSYSAGNLIHLCRLLDISLVGIDFSQLAVWHTSLQRLSLQGAAFSHAQFAYAQFATALGQEPVAVFSADGAWLVVGDRDGRLMLWDAGLGKLHQLLTAGGGVPIRALALAAAGDQLAVGGEDGSLTLWSLQTSYDPDPLCEGGEAICALAFSPDGDWLAVGDEAGGIRLWELASGMDTPLPSPHHYPIRQLRMASATQLVSCCEGQLACLWQLPEGQLRRLQPGTPGWPSTVELLPGAEDNTAITVGYEDQCLMVWEIGADRPRLSIPLREQSPVALALSADGRYLAYSCTDNSVTLLDLVSRQVRSILDGVGSSTCWTHLAFSPDSRLLVTAGDYAIRLWEAAQGDCLHSLRSQRYPVGQLAFSHDSQRLVTGHADGRVRLWSLSATGSFAPQKRSLKGHRRSVEALAVSADGRWLASGDGQELRLWQREAGICHRSWGDPPADSAALAFSADSRWLVSGAEDATVRAWHLETQETRYFNGHAERITAVALSADGQHLVSGGRDRTLRLWQVATGQLQHQWDVPSGQVCSLRVDSGGQHLLSATQDGSVCLWQLPEVSCLHRWQAQPEQLVRGLMFDASGEPVVVLSRAEVLELWSVVQDVCLQRFVGHSQYIWGTSVSPDGQYVASVSQDDEIRVWQMATGRCDRTLRPDRPYEGVSIYGAKGLSESETQMLLSLGAVTP